MHLCAENFDDLAPAPTTIISRYIAGFAGGRFKRQSSERPLVHSTTSLRVNRVTYRKKSERGKAQWIVARIC